jgi:hypothetical protein
MLDQTDRIADEYYMGHDTQYSHWYFGPNK